MEEQERSVQHWILSDGPIRDEVNRFAALVKGLEWERKEKPVGKRVEPKFAYLVTAYRRITIGQSIEERHTVY